MTTAEMLTRIRTFLDEASASFWSDTEIYSALADGQNEVISICLNFYRAKKEVNSRTELPQVLTALHTHVADTNLTGIVTAPADYLFLLGGYYSDDTPTQSPKAFTVKDYGLNYFHDYYNTYLAPTANDPIAIVANTSGGVLSIYFIPAPTGGDTAQYAFEYLRKPTAIASGVNPTLSVFAHNAIVTYAFAQLLLKDDRMQEAQAQYQIFINMVQNFIQV